MIWFTSDLHLYHETVATKHRGFDNCSDMHEFIINNWNSVVGENDTIYIVGDISLKHNIDNISSIMNRLNGNKHLIIGNHDRKVSKNVRFTNLFSSVNEYIELKHNNTKFCLFHYPMEYWNRKHFGSIHIHGHLHSSNPIRFSDRRMIDVGLDGHRGIPWNIDEIYEEMMKIEFSTKDHHV